MKIDDHSIVVGNVDALMDEALDIVRFGPSVVLTDDSYGIRDIDVTRDLIVLGCLHVKGDLWVQGDLVVLGDLYWSHMHTPRVGGRFFHRRVLPQSCQRKHWAERLGMTFPDNSCYDEIIEQVIPELPRLLRSRKWSKTERWMLTSLEREDADLDEWVVDLFKKYDLTEEPWRRGSPKR